MVIDELRRRRRKRSLEKWIFRALLAEAFFVALSPTAATVAVLFGAVLTAMRFYTVKDAKFRFLPFDVPAALFAIFGAVSVFVSPDPSFSFYNYYNLVGVYALTYIVAGQNVKNAAELKKIALALASSAVLVALYGFFQFAFGAETEEMRWVDGEAFPMITQRIFSTFENPNILAGYLDAVICVMFGFFVKSGNRFQKLVLVAAMIMMGICLVMTYSRGAIFTLAVIFFCYGAVKDWRVLLACFVVGGAAMLLDPALGERLMSVFTKNDTSSDMRLAIWESTVAMIEDHPFFGIGWGAYFMVYPEYDYYLQGANVKIVHAHNLYLNYAAEIGIAGTLAFLWHFFGTMKTALTAKIFPKEIAVVVELPDDEKIFGDISEKLADIKAEENDDAEKTDDNDAEKTDGENVEAKNDEPDDDKAKNDAKDDAEDDAADKETDGKVVSLADIRNRKNRRSEADAKKDSEQDADEETTETKDDATEETAAANESDDDDAATNEEADEETREEEEADETKAETADESDEDGGDETENKAEADDATDKEPTDGDAADEVDDADESEAAPAKTFAERLDEFLTWDDDRVEAALVFGAGLAFVSVALNGVTDDLLFNIPTSMMFWLLSALTAVAVRLSETEMPEEDMQ